MAAVSPASAIWQLEPPRGPGAECAFATWRMDSGSPPAWLLWAIANGSGFVGPGCSLQEMVGREPLADTPIAFTGRKGRGASERL